MHTAKNLVLSVLSVVLFGCLLGGALSTSAVSSFGHAGPIKKWVHESPLYNTIVGQATGQAQTTYSAQLTELGVDQSTLNQSVSSALSKQYVEQNVDKVIDSNYQWLEGKTSTPQFNIDTTSLKQSLASQVTSKKSAQLNSLPDCNLLQTVALQRAGSIDLSSLTCKPVGIDINSELQTFQDSIANNSGFLSDNITYNNINSALGQSGSTSYASYVSQKKQIPQAFQLFIKLPAIFGIAGFLSLAALIAIGRTTGAKRAGQIAITAGVIVLAIMLCTTLIRHAIDGKITGVGQYASVITYVLKKAFSHISTLELIFGIVYVVTGVIAIAVSRRLENARSSPYKVT